MLFPKKYRLLSPVFILLFLMVIYNPKTDAQLESGQDKFVGNIIPATVPDYFDVYWNQVTPENSGKWGSVEGVRDAMNWSELDIAYNHALTNGYAFKQHAFVWGQQEPLWASTLSAAQQASEVEEWIQLFCQRYPATDMIDVVNEPLHVVPSYANAMVVMAQAAGTGLSGLSKKLVSIALMQS